MDQNNGNGYNQGQYGMGQYDMEQPGMGQYDMGQPGMGQPGMGQPGMNLPYNGNPGTFNPQIDYAQQNAGMQNTDYAGQNAGKQKKQKRQNSKSMKLADQSKKRGKGGIIAAIAAVVLIAAGVGTYFLFFTPEKRLERQLAAGQEALDGQEYDAAIEAYDKALEIDGENLTAIKGILNAYKGNDDTAGLQSAFEEYRQVIMSMEQEAWEQNVNVLVDIYMMSELAYPEDTESRIASLKEGMMVTSDNERIRNKLVDAYLGCAASEEEEEDYESALDFYAEVLALEASNETAVAERKTCIEKILNGMIVAEDFDAALDFIDEYKDEVDNVNFTEYEQTIDNKKQLAAAGHELMENVIACMSEGRYDDMQALDGSQNASTVYSLMSGNSYIYAQDGYSEDYTGTAAGLYATEYGYYFYYGEYVDGERSGHGVYYVLMDEDNNSYELYDGAWANDKPNGHGTFSKCNYVSDGEIITTAAEGDFTDGYEDGTFSATLTSSEGYTVTGGWTASMGTVTDVREQYPDLDFGDISEDRIVYVVMRDENDTAVWFLSIKEGGYLKLMAF